MHDAAKNTDATELRHTMRALVDEMGLMGAVRHTGVSRTSVERILGGLPVRPGTELRVRTQLAAIAGHGTRGLSDGVTVIAAVDDQAPEIALGKAFALAVRQYQVTPHPESTMSGHEMLMMLATSVALRELVRLAAADAADTKTETTHGDNR